MVSCTEVRLVLSASVMLTALPLAAPNTSGSFIAVPAVEVYVLTGASLAAVRLIVEVTVFELFWLSLAVKLTVRASVDGLSEELE